MRRIKKIFTVIGIAILCLSSYQNAGIKESSFCKSLVPGKYILDAGDGWWHWCMAPIYDEDEKLHVFMSAIPNAGSWASDSKIVHYMADSPEGPYQFVDTTFASSSASYHNPQISKVGDTYVLVFLLRDALIPGSKQEIGIATAKSVYGPWTESPLNPIIKAEGQMDGATINHASNPTFLVDKEGKYRIYFKSMTDKYGGESYREISLAISDHIEGPYKNHPNNPLISYADQGLDIEDPYAFYYKGLYHMIVEDRRGVKDMLEGYPDPGCNQKARRMAPRLIVYIKRRYKMGHTRNRIPDQ